MTVEAAVSGYRDGEARQGIVIRGNDLAEPTALTIGAMLREAAALAPTRPFLLHPGAPGANSITYSDMLEGAKIRAAALVAQELGAERPLAILSGNSIEHAMLVMGATLAGIPVSPISTAYSQVKDTSRLRGVLETLGPGLVYAESSEAFAPGIDVARSLGIAVMTGDGGGDTRPLGALLADFGARDAPEDLCTPDTVARILFTSGSTGAPKGVMVTHRMAVSNQQGMRQVWPFLAEEPPLIVDWLPWNHIFGGNLVFNMALRNAGTLVIDDGRPVPGLFDRTIANLTANPPTVHLGVPRGFQELVCRMEDDAAFAAIYFSRMRAMFTAGAALPANVWTQYRALAARHSRPDFRTYVAWGSTETAPVASIAPPDNERPDNIGYPLPGAELKLVPNEDKTEIRVRGPMVTPGYWRRPDLNAEAFDDEGFYQIGDAGRLLDPDDPSRGILFDGRIAENFKLITGTWVHVGNLRLRAVTAGRPLIQDVAITGHNEEEIGALVFLDLAAARRIADAPEATLATLATHPAIRARIAATLTELSQGSSSTRIARALVQPDMPSFETGEMTDKGYLNQRACLRARADAVARLHAETPDADVIRPA